MPGLASRRSRERSLILSHCSVLSGFPISKERGRSPGVCSSARVAGAVLQRRCVQVGTYDESLRTARAPVSVLSLTEPQMGSTS